MKHTKSLLNIILVTALATGTVVLVVFLSRGSSGGDAFESPVVFAMDTSLQITIHDRGDSAGKDFDRAVDLVKSIESYTSRFSEDSDVAIINRNAGAAPVEVHPETMDMLVRSLEYSELSDGAFDITVAPISELWGFYDEQYAIPGDSEIREVLTLVDYRNVIVNPEAGTVMLARAGMEIDLGAVAKGYAVGAVCEMLRQGGVEHALVNFGGTVGAVGGRSDGKPWVVGVRNPRGEAGDLIGTIGLEDCYVASSGDYERYFTEAGVRYCHIFDPVTGKQPRVIISDSVVGPDPMDADVLSTTIFVTGDEGLPLALEKGYEVLLVDESGEVELTPGMRDGYVMEIQESL
jgi:FAD:protein FMN transferase